VGDGVIGRIDSVLADHLGGQHAADLPPSIGTAGFEVGHRRCTQAWSEQ
jgi:hypothetical protein